MKHYTIMTALGHEKIFNHVYCKEKDLETIADSIWRYYEYVLHEKNIACVAKEGFWNGEGMHDFLFQDCM